MKLNHLGITVTDVGAATTFLETHFGMRPVGKTGRKLGHVQDDDGLILSLFLKGWMGATLTEPTSTHIGFMVATRAEVDAKHAELTAAGFKPPEPVDAHGYTFAFTAPGGFAVEVVS